MNPRSARVGATAPNPAQRFRESTFGGPGAALAAILAGAAALRVVGIAYGRPFPLFSPDEQSIVPRAWHMVHGGGLDPHWFDYPTLLMYLLAPFQAWQSAPSYLAARFVVLALALAAIAAAWWLGSRAYGGPAGAVAEIDLCRRDEVAELERAGVDAVIVRAGSVAELIGEPPPEV